MKTSLGLIQLLQRKELYEEYREVLRQLGSDSLNSADSGRPCDNLGSRVAQDRLARMSLIEVRNPCPEHLVCP